MPAMPTGPIDTVISFEDLTGGGRFLPANGLTKREMFAKDADVTDLMATLCDDTIKGLADGKLNWDRFTDKAKAYFAVEAKFKMIKADVLLAELEKQQCKK